MTNHDKELRGLLIDLTSTAQSATHGFVAEEQPKIDAAVAEAFEDIQELITTDRERAVKEARIDELKNMLGQAREHTINDIERIMYHTKSKVDFIEAVKTDLIVERIATLSTQEGGKDE